MLRRVPCRFLFVALLFLMNSSTSRAVGFRDLYQYCAQWVSYRQPGTAGVSRRPMRRYELRDFPKSASLHSKYHSFASFYRPIIAEQANEVADRFLEGQSTEALLQTVAQRLTEAVIAQRQDRVQLTRYFGERRTYHSTGLLYLNIGETHEKYGVSYDLSAGDRIELRRGFRREFALLAERSGMRDSTPFDDWVQSLYRRKYTFYSLQFQQQPIRASTLVASDREASADSIAVIYPEPDDAAAILKDVLQRLEELRFSDLPRKEKLRGFLYAYYGYTQAEFYGEGTHEIGVPFFAGLYLAIFGEQIPKQASGRFLLSSMSRGAEGFIENMERYYEVP